MAQAVVKVLVAVVLEVIELLVLDPHLYKETQLLWIQDQIILLQLVLVEHTTDLILAHLLELMDLEMELHLF